MKNSQDDPIETAGVSGRGFCAGADTPFRTGEDEVIEIVGLSVCGADTKASVSGDGCGLSRVVAREMRLV